MTSLVLFSGCMMLFRTKALKEIGGFSEKFFLYFEDYDLSLKTLNHSPAIIDSEFIINHSGGGANRKGLKHWFYFIQSAIIFFYLSKY